MNKTTITLILSHLNRENVKKNLSIITVYFSMFDDLIYINVVTYKNDCTFNYHHKSIILERFLDSKSFYYEINFSF